MKPRRLLLATAVPLAVLLAGCGGASDDNATSAESGGGASRSAADSGITDGIADGDAPNTAAKPASNAVIQRSVIATGALRVSARHLDDARQDAINLATGLGGHVADEQSRSDAHGRLDRVDLTVRVPSASFEKALDGLSALGTVRHREQSVEDVTTQVIDNAARVKAQEASVASIERLLSRATTIAEIMSVEEQLARRQADLDSLKQQQKWLADQTSLSTIQLTLTKPTAAKDGGGSGFLSGFASGWHALVRTAVALGTALGAVLPFAAVVALVGGPVWLVVRRRRAVAAPPAAS